VGSINVRWINTRLGSRGITVTLSVETLEVSATRGCLHGGILSTLLWSLVVDELLA
jgi:hypothetical protein